MAKVYLEDGGFISPPKEIENVNARDFEKRSRHLNGLLGLENEELREQMIADIVKAVPAFREIAEIITEKKEAFLIGSLTASFKKRENHMISLLSSELEGLPVFVKPIAFEPNETYIYDIIVPATEQLIEDNDRDPNKIAVEQFEIIKNVIPWEYKKAQLSIRLEYSIPSPIIKMFNRSGFWTVWRVYKGMKDFDEFWSQDMCGTMYQDVQPFIGTDKYEFAMILNEEVYKSEFDTLMATLKENIKEKHDLRLEDTFTLHVSYGWLIRSAILKEKKEMLPSIFAQRKEILSTLTRGTPIMGRGIPGAYFGEERPEYDNVSRIISQPTFIRLPGFVYSDEVKKKCSIRWRK
jgi:hypothetical protein